MSPRSFPWASLKRQFPLETSVLTACAELQRQRPLRLQRVVNLGGVRPLGKIDHVVEGRRLPASAASGGPADRETLSTGITRALAMIKGLSCEKYGQRKRVLSIRILGLFNAQLSRVL